MKTIVATVIACVLLSAAFAHAYEYKIEFVTSDELFETRLTKADIAKIKIMVREAYPEAADAVVNFVGDESAREVLKDIYITIYDANPDWWGTNGYSINWNSGPRKKKQNITLIGQSLLSGAKDVKTLLTHELIHVVFETRCSFDEARSQKRYLKEGLAYYGSGDTHATVVAALNKFRPKYDIKDVLKKKSRRRYFRQRTYIHCFEKVYGAKAKEELIRLLFGGKHWESALKKASGDERKKVYKKCKRCMKKYVQSILDASPAFQDVERAYDNEDYKYAVYLGEKLLEKNPKSDWRFSTHWRLGVAYRQIYELEKSTGHFEILKSSQSGLNYLGDNVAYMIIKNMVRDGQCDEALKTRQEWDRLYPLFWKHWRDDLEELFADNCDESDALFFKGRKQFEHEKRKEAEESFQQALKSIQSQDSPDKKDIERALYNLGENCLENKDYEKAEGYFIKGIEAAKDAWAPDGNRVFANYRAQAKTYLKQDMHEKEKEVWTQYLNYLRGEKIANEYYIGRAIKGIGDALRKMEQHEQALRHYEEALPIYKNNLKKDDLWIAWLHHDMSLSLAALGRWDEAGKSFEAALEIRREKYPSIYPDTAKTLMELAQVHAELKSHKKAGELAREALGMYEKYPFTEAEDLEKAKALVEKLPAGQANEAAQPLSSADSP
jgi:tetratricopeptide (TPR) repeat protein